MKYKLYTTSEKAWDGMLQAIRSAEKSIYIEMYIFVDNIPEYDFFEALRQKAKEGVKVKIIVDSFGSNGIKTQAIEKIKESGAELMFFSYWTQRTHKKILIVDEKIAFLGGVNIHKLFKKWNDLQIRLTGPIVRKVTRSFARTYELCGGKDLNVLAYSAKKNIFKKTGVLFFEQWKFNRENSIKKHYQKIIEEALNNIVLTTPYLVPNKWFVSAIHQAILRGVSVQILLPEYTDNWIMDRINLFYMRKLHSLGAVIYLHKEMNHAKTILIDNKKGVIGSQNIDPFSLGYNLEAGVILQEKNIIEDIKNVILKWKQGSTIFNPLNKKLQWFDYILAKFIRIFKINL